jgi:hypothetical protein
MTHVETDDRMIDGSVRTAITSSDRSPARTGSATDATPAPVLGRIEKSYERLLQWIETEGLAGWDPYDGLNTPYRLLTGTKAARLFSMYVHKFSPFNLRPLFGVRRSRQLQALAFLGLALTRHSGQGDRRKLVRSIVAEIKADTLHKDFGYHCWESHGFPIQMRKRYRPVGIPDVVGNEACGRLLYAARAGDPEAEAMALSFRDYLLDQLLVDSDNATFFRYKPVTPEWSCTYNASLLAAQYVMDMDRATGAAAPRPVIERCFRYVCARQHPEGFWRYSIDLRTGREKHQIDFHQGFILDSLLRYMQLHGFEEPFLGCYRRGMAFYRENQFLESGQGIYRHPRKWPVNIQNQAQGIMTFSQAGWLDSEYTAFARTIAEWTIDTMQDPKGHFYFLKYPLVTNRIPYIRWSDVGMACALATLLQPLCGNATLVVGSTIQPR